MLPIAGLIAKLSAVTKYLVHSIYSVWYNSMNKFYSCRYCLKKMWSLQVNGSKLQMDQRRNNHSNETLSKQETQQCFIPGSLGVGMLRQRLCRWLKLV